MLQKLIVLMILLVCCFATAVDAAVKLPQKFQLSFQSKKELKLFNGIGAKPALTPKVSTQKGSGALVLEPGVSIEMPIFQKADGVGSVTVSFYDDMTSPADSTAHRRGPSFGLRNKDGFELSIGLLYASFTDSAQYYYLNHYRHSDKSQTPTAWVKHIRCKRSKGWQTFSFEFDGRKGLIIKHNGKDINHGLGEKPFNWTEIKFGAFDKLIFHGDKKDADAQTVFIDDIQVQLGKEGVALKP